MIAPLASRSGYGDHARDLAYSLIKYKSDLFDYKFVNVGWGACPNTEFNNNNHEELTKRVLTQPLNKQPEVHIQVTIPPEFKNMGKYNIGITAGIETTLCKAEWLESLNKMNLIIVPSQHAKNVFLGTTATKKHPNGMEEQIKCNAPIEVLFEGADTNIYKKTNVIPNSLNFLNDIEEEFAFLFVGHWIQGEFGHDRKDIGMMIKIFLETFKNSKKKPALVLKTSGATMSIMDRDDILSKINDIRKTVNSDNVPNIYLVHGTLSQEEMNGLYNHPKIKAHVNTSHGEGFCRPLLEASLSEKPIIASNWSGHLDFLNPEYANLIDGQLQPVHPSCVNEWIIKESAWFYCNYSLLSNKMKDVFENYNSYIGKAKKLTEENKVKFSLEAMDIKFHKILNEYLPQFEQEVKINLPKLKMISSDSENQEVSSLPTIKLPQLRKVE
jgi:glycosyltransferase involved in cell wall biosynthesis